jgi:hypothetical protein
MAAIAIPPRGQNVLNAGWGQPLILLGNAQGGEGRTIDAGVVRAAERWRGPSAFIAGLFAGRGEDRAAATEGAAMPTHRISPLAYCRAVGTLFWTALRHPLSTTPIDLSTGRVATEEPPHDGPEDPAPDHLV